MSPGSWALLITIVVAALSPFATWLVARNRPRVDAAEATDIITTAADRVIKNVVSDNVYLRLELDQLRTDLNMLGDQLRTARSEVSSLRHELAQERVDHEETREQVASLTIEVNRLTALDTPPHGTPTTRENP